MVSDKLKQLAAARAQVADLEKAVAAELATLPARFGFSDVKSFLRAVRSASGGKGRRAARTATKQTARRKRAIVTDDTRALVKKLANEGKTGSEIAKEAGVSLPTVQNIKKALGLAKKRS